MEGTQSYQRLKRIQPFMRKYAPDMEDIADKYDLIFDQYLASLWHETNHGGEFGNQKWHYYAFELCKKLGNGLLLCLFADGTPFILHSESLCIKFDEGVFSCLSVLVDMDGWYCAYGLIFHWKASKPSDFELLAEHLIPQTYKANGLSAVVQFNPFPFWALARHAKIKPCFYDGRYVMTSYLYARVVNKELFEMLSCNNSSWTCTKNGKYENWNLSSENTFECADIYRDTKTGEIILVSNFEEYFDNFTHNFSKYFDSKQTRIEKVSYAFAPIIENYPVKGFGINLEKMRKLFAEEE